MLPNRRFANSTLTRASAGTVARRQWSVFPCPVPDELLAEPCVSAENAANYRRARLLVLGRITAWKGQEIALRALEHLVDAGHDVELHIVGSPQFPGDGKYELRLHALAANPKIAARVHFRGHSEDPASALRDADIALHTSLRPEPFGQVIVEAMAAGTPIVAASNAGAIEWLTPGSDCTTYTMGDARGLARQVSHLLAQPDEARRIAKNARLTAESLSVKEIGPRIENELIVAAGPSA
nr:glycosyltransferase family 4 protein [Leucobacter aridicollis]